MKKKIKKDKEVPIHGFLECSEGTYSGETFNGKKEGYGILKSDGSTYEGYWKNDLKHGRGKLKTDSLMIEGVWEDGFMI